MAIATPQQLGELTPENLVSYLAAYRSWIGQLKQEASAFYEFLRFAGTDMAEPTLGNVDTATKQRFLAIWATEPNIADYQNGV